MTPVDWYSIQQFQIADKGLANALHDFQKKIL